MLAMTTSVSGPTTSVSAWGPILLLLVIALVFAVGTLVLSSWVGRSRSGPVKGSPYEAGIAPAGPARGRFGVRYYLVAILFLVFDVEAVLLFPWAVLFGGPAGSHADTALLVEMFLFLLVLAVGLVYAWRRGVLAAD